MRTRSLLLWPFALVWAVIRLLIWPALVALVCWFVLPPGWFAIVAIVLGLYSLLVLRLWSRVVRGVLSSMTRGTVTVRGYTPRRRGRGRGRRSW